MNGRIITAIALVVVALSIIPVAVEDSEGATYISYDSNSFEIESDGGYISFHVQSDTSFSMHVQVDVKSSTKTWTSQTDVEIVPGDNKVSVHIAGRDAGTYSITVTCTPERYFDESNTFNATLTVTTGILYRWTTWAVVIAVIIVVAILVYLRIRDSSIRRQPEMTFEELEEQRKAEMAAKGAKRSSGSGSTERQRYLESRRRGKE